MKTETEAAEIRTTTADALFELGRHAIANGQSLIKLAYRIRGGHGFDAYGKSKKDGRRQIGTQVNRYANGGYAYSDRVGELCAALVELEAEESARAQRKVSKRQRRVRRAIATNVVHATFGGEARS